MQKKLRASKEAIELIASFEGFEAKAYKCPAGVWTVGYGHTRYAKEGIVVTKSQALEVLADDVKTAEDCVDRNIDQQLTQCQFDALVSFVFNVGSGNFESSTLLRYMKEGSPWDAANEFTKWVYAGGKKLEGLRVRRLKERLVFCWGHGFENKLH